MLGMKNWQGYPKVAQNAAWGSLMSADLGHKNYFEGKNVHISFHEQLYGDKKVHYLNVSHHYRFEIQKDQQSGRYLLYQLQSELEPQSTSKIVYVLFNKQINSISSEAIS